MHVIVILVHFILNQFSSETVPTDEGGFNSVAEIYFEAAGSALIAVQAFDDTLTPWVYPYLLLYLSSGAVWRSPTVFTIVLTPLTPDPFALRTSGNYDFGTNHGNYGFQ